ncbi:MAG TPA: hypothetical protein VN417_05645 [Candidatus Cryosericum sp.]|nr:hypothetical protein [Candidatus Cryosericum sp.]
MKRFSQSSTDRLLTLGMALYADQKTMERRVRGVFARKKSTKPARVLALILCMALAAGCFTTACQPGTQSVSAGNAAVSGADAALVSGGNASSGNASSGNASAGSVSAAGQTPEVTKAQTMEWHQQELAQARTFVAPPVRDIYRDQLGDWRADEDPNAALAEAINAAEAFLVIANQVFNTSYTAADMTATYYTDASGFRSDVYRLDSKDGVLSGAVDAKSFALICANCGVEPADKAHQSLLDAGDLLDTDFGDNLLDTTDAAKRLAAIFGGDASAAVKQGASYGDNKLAGWNMQVTVTFPLKDGKFCRAMIFGDQNLTVSSIGVYPDSTCADEDVYWRADLVWAEGVITLAAPQDFRKGEPGKDDMPVEQAFELYYKLVAAAGPLDSPIIGQPKEPNATFYVDYSGARENYWHIEGEYARFDLTSKTGHMLNLEANSKLGSSMELETIDYEHMGGQEYIDATRALFTALFGEGSVKDVLMNAVYDYHYCTVDPIMADGTAYEIMFQDGLIVEATFFSTQEKSGFGTDPDWAADWIYKNNETGETFHMEW